MRNGAVTTTAATAAVALAAVIAASCGAGGDGGGLFRQYEYEEEVYLSLDGSATVYVHSSLPALNALRGAGFATTPNAPIDREAVRAFFSTPVTRVVGPIDASRRRNRRFVHVRLAVDDIRRLSDAAPFAWSAYELERNGDLYSFRQTVGNAAGKEVGDVGWTGQELVAFRLHLPSRIQYHNSGGDIGRGNILVWEQPFTARQRGVRLTLDARMDPDSILYRTLWLFGWTFVAVAVTFSLVIAMIVRRAPMEKRAA
jgi:hypothetical protein